MTFLAVLASPSPAASIPSSPATRHRPTLRALALPHLPAAAVLGGSSIAAFAAALSLSDPERRRRLQAAEVGGDDKDVVREYFNTTGFERWRKIYGESFDGVNKVQLDIRVGHSKTVESAIAMLRDGGPLSGVTICDAGCGTGSLAIPLVREGAVVTAIDISAAMVEEARRRTEVELGGGSGGVPMPRFQVRDLEGLEGRWDTVVCLDVLIHYPQVKAEEMIEQLASLAERRLLLSFAPKTAFYTLLKRVGELFPGTSKATRAYLHAEADVERALRRASWRVSKRAFINTQFYFAKLLEAVPAASPA